MPYFYQGEAVYTCGHTDYTEFETDEIDYDIPKIDDICPTCANRIQQVKNYWSLPNTEAKTILDTVQRIP